MTIDVRKPDELDTIIESIVTAGDISRLDPHQKAIYYRRRCESLGLDPSSKPFDVLRLSGKEVLYLNRGGTDQLAKIHHVSRRIVEGPCCKTIEGTKMAYAKCEASTPDGRVEEVIATAPWADPTMILMKIETKAKRRATISITGAAALDESEIADIPDREKSPAKPISVTVTMDDGALPEPLQRLVDDVAQLGTTLTLAQVRTLYSEHIPPMPDGLYARARAVLCDVMPVGITIASPDHRTLLRNPGTENPTIEQHIASVQAADSVRALEMLRDSLPKSALAALKQHMFIRRVALSPDLADLDTLRPVAARLQSDTMRLAVLAAIEIRARELAGPTPPDGTDDPDADVEREAIQGEAVLDAAVDKLHSTHGPRHAVSHYLAHRNELPAALQPAYRRALIEHLPRRYPKDVRTRSRAEAIVSEAEQGSVRRAA
jgi:hypothetical protein